MCRNHAQSVEAGRPTVDVIKQTTTYAQDLFNPRRLPSLLHHDKHRCENREDCVRVSGKNEQSKEQKHMNPKGRVAQYVPKQTNQRTNIEQVTDYMEYGSPLNQAFVMEAIQRYAQECVDKRECLIAQMKMSFVSGEAWVECAENWLKRGK